MKNNFVMCDEWDDVYEKRREKEEEKIQAPTLGEIRPVLRRKRGTCRFCEGNPHLPRERLRKGRVGREPSDSLAPGADWANQGGLRVR